MDQRVDIFLKSVPNLNICQLKKNWPIHSLEGLYLFPLLLAVDEASFSALLATLNILLFEFLPF